MGFEPVPRGNHPPQVTAVCDDCGATHTMTCDYQTVGRGGHQKHNPQPNYGQAIAKMRGRKWTYLKKVLRCGQCDARRRAREGQKELFHPKTGTPAQVPQMSPSSPIASLTTLAEASPITPKTARKKSVDRTKAGTAARRAKLLDLIKIGVLDLHVLTAAQGSCFTTTLQDLKFLGITHSGHHGHHRATVIPPKEEPMNIKPDASTEPLRHPTRDQIRSIQKMLDDEYDVTAQRYKGSTTDVTIAEVLGGGVMFGWVAEERERAYGPAGNDEIDKLTDDIAALRLQMAEADVEMHRLHEWLVVQSKECDGMKTALDELARRQQAIKAGLGPRGARL